MKKYLWFLVSILAVIFVAFAWQNQKDNVLGTHQEATIKPESSFENAVDIDFKGKQITAVWYIVTDPFKLTLIPNFDKKEDAIEVYEREECKILTNGSFYTTDDKPIGLFISEGTTLRNSVSNGLVDGILSVNYINTPRITRVVPRDPLRIGLQTGPIIKENSFYQKLNTTNDKESRRSIAAVSGANELYFLIFFNKDSAYIGPNLNDMPELLKLFEEKSKIEFADAINLDGGSASAFYTKGFSLSEFSPLGSFFCEK